MKDITRRDFITKSGKAASLGLGAMAIGSGAFTTRTAGAAKIPFPESSCDTDTANAPKILIAYASMFGSTGGVADALGQELCRKGAQVDVRNIENVTQVDSYHAVIVGSAIRSSKWLPEAVGFVGDHQKTFSEIHVAYFLTCLTLSRSNEETLKKAEAFLLPLKDSFPEVKPVGTGLFAGVLDYGKMSFPMRIIMKQKMKKTGVEEADYRNWDNVSAWASGLYPKLVGI